MRHNHSSSEPISHNLTRVLHGDGLGEIPRSRAADLSDCGESNSIEFAVAAAGSAQCVHLLGPVEGVRRGHWRSQKRRGSQNLDAKLFFKTLEVSKIRSVLFQRTNRPASHIIHLAHALHHRECNVGALRTQLSVDVCPDRADFTNVVRCRSVPGIN
jgi:hypothetical protein